MTTRPPGRKAGRFHSEWKLHQQFESDTAAGMFPLHALTGLGLHCTLQMRLKLALQTLFGSGTKKTRVATN